MFSCATEPSEMTKIEIQGHDTHQANVRAIEISGSEEQGAAGAVEVCTVLG